MKPNIVVLDGAVVNPGDLSWLPIARHGNLKVYDATTKNEIIPRLSEADMVLINKVVLTKDHFEALTRLKFVGLLATGFDNVDIAAARANGIAVYNAVDYGSDAVAQHVFALLLSRANKIVDHNRSVQAGEWSSKPWCYALDTLQGLSGKTIGIIGFGKIGRAVARIAAAFNMKVLILRRDKKSEPKDLDQTNLQDLLAKSDIISLHIPLNSDTQGMIDKDWLSKMKEDATLVNTARGGLINEIDLRKHLQDHINFTALLDVLSSEPPPRDHPLIGLENCIITPHNAWANLQARENLIDIVGKNIEAFMNGDATNRVN